MNKTQRSYLQQALWKLEQAKRLVELSLDETGSGQVYIWGIEKYMEEMEADLAESYETEKV